ncbi:MAG: sugar phosphate isomerase/epimerase [Ruminococcaceae bacterium]|nr:sugar phosphate isomerase/epimerase [Oscillospiraceae bacterium]
MRKCMISGFADEASKDFLTQVETVKKLGMEYLCLRALDGRSIADYTEAEAVNYIKPKLDEYGLKVSSIGSPIGKVPVNDEEAFEKQLVQLEELCKIANVVGARYIRLFSFYMPKDEDPAPYFDTVVAKMRRFVEICDRYGVIAMHENEKGIYGDTGARCLELYKAFEGTTMAAAYDFANYVQCDEDPVECYELVKDYIAYVHVKDARKSDHRNVLCATGDGQIPKILADLKARGYDGFLTMEPHLRTFESLKNLEATVAETLVQDAYEDGVSAYTAQYNALCAVLDSIGVN